VKIHPLTIILIGILLISILTNYVQHRSYVKLQKEMGQSKTLIFTFPEKENIIRKKPIDKWVL